MDVVFDVNILVSALISEGKPKQLWLKAVHGEFELVSSKGIIDDFVEVMGRSKFERYVDDGDMLDFVQALSATAKFVRTKSKFKIVKEDPEDDVILATAYDGDAEYVVSGDRHLLNMKEFRGIKIVTADKMIQILSAEKV
ncbi:MAG: putative toxin-antitoxin system toxin component, PIN family [Nitrososphaerales archaeon]